MTTRRGFITGLASIIASPAIVPFASLMPVRGIVMDARVTVDLNEIAREALRPFIFRLRESELNQRIWVCGVYGSDQDLSVTVNGRKAERIT